MRIDLGTSARSMHRVRRDDTALQWGSTFAVLSSPTLIGLLEKTCVEATDHLLPEGQTTVGTGFDVEHLAPSPVGKTLQLSATLCEHEGRRLVFRVEARDSEEPVFAGRFHRAIVDGEMFRGQIARKAAVADGKFED